MKVNTNLLTKALEAKAINDGQSGVFINVMNNEKSSNVIKEEGALVRENHNYSHITFIKYLDYGNGFKGFEPREWAYVVTTSDPNRFQIRKDLIDSWKDSNAKDTVIVISQADNTVHFLNMQDFMGFKPNVSWKYVWNEEGNIVLDFDSWKSSYTFVDSEPDTIHPYADKLEEGWNYLGKVSYSQYRSKRMVLVARYDDNGKLVNYHRMKSLVMAYEMLHLENNGALRSFRRNLAKNLSSFLISSDGVKYYITFTDITNSVPDTWSSQPVTIETESVIEELKVDGAEEKVGAIEVQEVTNIIANVDAVKDLTDMELGQVINEAISQLDTRPHRIIIRPEVKEKHEATDEELARILDQVNNPGWYNEDGTRKKRLVVR